MSQIYKVLQTIKRPLDVAAAGIMPASPVVRTLTINFLADLKFSVVG